MNAISTNDVTASTLARRRMLSRRGEPLLIAAWERVLMIHFEVDAEGLQRDVPYELDLRDGRAFVSLVAFTMRGMRLRAGGKLLEWLFRPIATHNFLNVRTYVRHNGETGIHFLAEWLSNRSAVLLGPTTFGLPYRYAHISYEHEWQGVFQGRVIDVRRNLALKYCAQPDHVYESFSHMERTVPDSPGCFRPCEAGSIDEWLMERYTAFNSARGRKRYFRVWHPPWPQCPVDVELRDISLLTQNWCWFRGARLICANYSPGFQEVWMGRPHPIKSR